MHTWKGCTCCRCGKKRDENHNWTKDCEKCVRCGKTRENAHAWSGCKCVNCGNIRDVAHVWSGGCTCVNCGKIRDVYHDWTSDCEKCAVCGKIRNNAHFVWKGIRCKTCNKIIGTTSLTNYNNCLVVRFDDVESRDLAFSALNQHFSYSHIQAIDSLRTDGVHYRKRGFAPGRFIIVLNSEYVHDTWHCREFKFLNDKKLQFRDIDYVTYQEIIEAV